jgi:hypothetical protein
VGKRATVMERSGPFAPDFDLRRLSRRTLAALAREYQLAGHLQDRAAMPQVRLRWGGSAMREIAIAEWMAASPVYTRRIQRTLGFSDGNDVATIFKGMQFDVGAPHGFLDFRFTLHPDGSGEFTLPYCGALMDVEPLGEKEVVGMCHQIEDPTFDATAGATNPRAQVRPVHRPPRVPADRLPHCHWRVRVEPDAAPVQEIALAGEAAASRLARLPTALPASDGEPGGRADYAGPFDPDLELEDLSHAALLAACREFCLQGHLLVRTLMLAIAERYGETAAREVASAQWIGIAAVAAERVARAMDVVGDDLDAIARVFQLHPAFHPREYVTFGVERRGDAVVCRIDECDALAEGDSWSWFALLDRGIHPALDAIARAVNPRAACRPCDVPGARLAWMVTIDPEAEAAPEPPEVMITRLSKGVTFHWASRRGA